jgi:hypothetical protein
MCRRRCFSTAAEGACVNAVARLGRRWWASGEEGVGWGAVGAAATMQRASIDRPTTSLAVG